MAFIRFSYIERIGLHHIALYRAWINGLDLQESGLRYIGENDPRIINSMIKGLRERFLQAAARANMHRYARLLSVRLRREDVVATPVATKKRPTLDEFREEYDPSDFYSENELIQLYSEHYPESPDPERNERSFRRQKWISEQSSALFWIQEFLSSSPLPHDTLEAWFEGTAVDHMQKAGILTLDDLKGFIEEFGKSWYSRVDGIGAAVAGRIVDWIDENAASLGPLPARARMTRLDVARSVSPSSGGAAMFFAERQGSTEAPRAPATLSNRPVAPRSQLTVIDAPVPALIPSDELLAALPLRRRPMQPPIEESLIGARSDLDAMNSWIEAKAGSDHTRRIYRREVERFLIFLEGEKSVGLRDALVEDVTDYRNFLSLVGRFKDGEPWPFRRPQSSYVGPRNTPRADPRWRPFAGPLQAQSAQYSLIVVKSFLDYLVKVRYIFANPMDSVSLKLAVVEQAPAPKGFSQGQFKLITEYVNSLPANHDGARRRFLTVFAYQSALRLSELAAATTSDITLIEKEREAGHHLLLSVLGKGNKRRTVYLGPEVDEAWSEYALWRDIQPNLSSVAEKDVPLIAGLDGAALSEARIYDMIKEIFLGASNLALARELWRDSDVIKKGSPHDFRHSRGRHLGQSALPLPMLQRLLGHSSISTTGIYTSNSDLEMAEALSAVSQTP